jgi:predicted dehydrogenase
MNKINVALASFGMSGKVFHAPLLYDHPGYTLSTIVERSKNTAATIYPNVKIVRSFDALLEDGSIELIIVNTPDITHFEYASKALEAGKHVVVEKPFTPTSEEGERLLEIAARRNKVLSVYQNARWNGDFLTVRKIIESGCLGKLVEYESNYTRFRNYIQSGSWKENVGFGKGIVYNLGSHMIDQALQLFGNPCDVWADVDALRPGGVIDDYCHIKLIYPNIKVTLKASYLVREEGARYTLHGVDGSFVKYGVDPQEEMLKKGFNPFNTGEWGKEPESVWGIINTSIDGLHYRGKIETVPGNYLAFYDNIYRVIRHQAKPDVLPEQAIEVIRVIEKIFGK